MFSNCIRHPFQKLQYVSPPLSTHTTTKRHVLPIVWNTHARIEKSTAEAHIKEWNSLTPTVTSSPAIASGIVNSSPDTLDLDNPEDLSIRSLLLGIVHRTAGDHIASRAFLVDAQKRQPELQTSTWVGGVALFELAVLDLKEAEAVTVSSTPEETKKTWALALKAATEKLNQALALATGNNSDLSSRLDSRIAMLKDEIATKKEMVGIV